MIKCHAGQYSIRLMCRLLRVSVSGYYDWLHQKPSCRAQKNQQLTQKIREAFEAEKGRAGAIRITIRLQENGTDAGKNRVAKIMRANAWRARAAKKYKATTNSNHQLPVAPNLLQQHFEASGPNEKYVSDALMMALWRRKMPKNVIVHSDRGSQYCSYAYQQLLKTHRLICSMSKRGDCYDNAAMESWNHSFKVEAIHEERFATRDQAKNHVFEYIEVYDNRYRLHSKLGYKSPVNFEVLKVA